MTAGPKQTRVALVTYAMHCGGMESYLLRLARYLRQQNYAVELITTVEPGEWFGRIAELGIGAEHISGYRPYGALVPMQHSLRVGARLARGDYDVILLHHARHAQAALARLPDHVVAIPVLHNDAEDIYRVGCGNPDAWNVAVAVSPKVAATARQRVPTRPVVEIWSGVDIPEAALLRRRPGIGPRVKLIFVGRVDHRQKGVFWLPDILKECRDRGIDVSLTVVGDGPDDAPLRRKLSEYGLESEVQHFRGLTPDQVYTHLLNSHILLMPSQYEGLPIALLESQACGCVPVVSRLPGITDAVVTHGETGMLADVGQVSDFTAAIAALHHDPGLWTSMSTAGFEKIRERFSVESMGRQYRQLIEDALQGRYPLPGRRKFQAPLRITMFPWRDFVPSSLRHLRRRWAVHFNPLAGSGSKRNHGV